ncbi:MAG: alpha/beta fold hydrolase [Chloroflexi bacterium]|nr:alpha/beta fold hydrolase [Chloroflexota bacterium]
MTHPETTRTHPGGNTVSEQPVTFGSKGIKLNGTIFIPGNAGKSNRLPGAVMCHGYGCDQAVFENSARALAEEGIITLTFDFRGHGSSGGKLDGSIIEDVMDAWEYLHNQPEVDRKRMGLIGHSMGAFSAILAAGKLNKARVLVALACPGEINNAVARNTGHIAHPLLRYIAVLVFLIATLVNKLKVRVEWKKFIEFWPKMKPSQALSGLEDCSKLFVFCLNDLISPYNRFLYSYAEASKPKQVMIGAGHHNTMMEPGSLRTQWHKWVVGALHGRHTV